MALGRVTTKAMALPTKLHKTQGLLITDHTAGETQLMMPADPDYDMVIHKITLTPTTAVNVTCAVDFGTVLASGAFTADTDALVDGQLTGVLSVNEVLEITDFASTLKMASPPFKPIVPKGYAITCTTYANGGTGAAWVTIYWYPKDWHTLKHD